MSKNDLSNLVNLERYPIDRPESPECLSTIEEAKKILKEEGLVVLDGFANPSLVEEVKGFADQNKDNIYTEVSEGNAYICDGDASLPADHPKNIIMQTQLGVLSYEQIPDEMRLYKFYHNDDIKKFVEKIIGRGEIFRYECDLGSINVAAMGKTDKLRWHFDNSDFVVSIPIQESESGGDYEYVFKIRDENSENYDEVKKLLDGDHSRVKKLVARPGSLVLFEGRYTIHRVTEITGESLRIVGLLGFASEPGVKSSPKLREIRYGK